MNKKTLNSKQLDQLADIATNCRYDPLKWANVAWNWGHGDLTNKKIRNWQAAVMAEIGRHIQNPAKRHTPLRIAIGSGHGIGKSACMGMISNWAMSCWRGARVLATANTENQLRTKTSPEVATWFRRSISASLFSIDTMSIKFREQSELPWVMDLVPWSEHNTEAFAGLHAEGRIILLLMDEASAIAEKIWEVAEGAMTDENTVIIWLAFGNFTRNVGRFRECFRKNRKYWTTKQIDSRDVEGTNKDFLNGLVEQYGEDSDFVKVRVRGMPPSAASRQLIPTHLVDQAFGRHLQQKSYNFAPVILACDPAWTGDDELVIGLRQGLKFEIFEKLPKNDNDINIARKLAWYEEKHQADAVFIDFGYGTGIKSAGDTMGRNWQLINFSEKAPIAGYANMRAFMWHAIATWLEEGGAIPPDDVLYQDLIGVETKPTLNGAIQLISKEDMKKLGLPSPNSGDTLALTFARPVVKKNFQSVFTIPQMSYINAAGNYNPFKER